jgi:competence protein ComEC
VVSKRRRIIDEQSGAVAFDYAAYLALQDIHSVMVYPHLELYSRNNGNPLLSGLYDLRSKLASSLAIALPEPQAALAQAMLLGMRHNIPEVVKGAFSHTGTYHLLAISGLHLGIVAALAVGLALPYWARLLLMSGWHWP